jgi:hypothetical protein
MNPNEILASLRGRGSTPLDELPPTSGIYGLRDHLGDIRYIGIAHSEGFRIRIRNKHRTGSEDRSHKFSAAYNVGRLWRDRRSCPPADAAISKRLRNALILEHCSASYVEVPNYRSKRDLEDLEAQVQRLADPNELAWLGKSFPPVDEPVELVERLIDRLRLPPFDRAALERQAERYRESHQ